MIDGPRLWLARLGGALPPEGDTWLDTSEVERLARFLDPMERQRRRLAWSLRRWALSQACPAIAEAEWRFVAGPHGKPRLAPSFAALGLDHNLSHGGAFAAMMVTSRPCGVDVETPPPDLDGLDIAFGPEERAAIAAHPRPAEAFLQLWVAKEALLKCVGTGFAVAPERVSLELASDGRSASVRYAEARLGIAPQQRIRLWPLPDGHWLAATQDGALEDLRPMPVPWQAS